MVPGKVVSVIITGKLNLNLSYILIYSEEEHVKVFSVMGNLSVNGKRTSNWYMTSLYISHYYYNLVTTILIFHHVRHKTLT